MRSPTCCSAGEKGIHHALDCHYVHWDAPCVECLFLRSLSRAPYRTPSACAKRRPTRTPHPIVPHPESIAAQAAYAEALLPGRLRPELFPGIGVLPGPATESHFVNRGTQ